MSQNPMNRQGHNPLDREEMESVLAARQEMGAEMEPALVDSFAEKILAEVRRQAEAERGVEQQKNDSNGTQLALGIVSLALAIPLTAIASGAGTFMMILVWLGIVAVNLAFAWSRHRG